MAKTRTPRASAPAYDPVNAGFLDARGKLIEVAAFLDRVERRGRADDFRVRALNAALRKVSAPGKHAQRAASVLRVLSDPTRAPVATAGLPACGAWEKMKIKAPRAKAATKH